MESAASSMSYEKEFEELRCIGRGNFGAAFLVKLRNPPAGFEGETHYIAKKIVLGQLTPKEQEAALLEVTHFGLNRQGQPAKEPDSPQHRRVQGEHH